MLATINTLYKPLGFKPTDNPLLHRLQQALVHNHTLHLVEHSEVFNLSVITKLFNNWGNKLSNERLRAKLLVLLCILGILHVSTAILPCFNNIQVEEVNRKCALIIAVVSYKNNHFREGNTVHIFKCTVQHYCLVATFIEWKHCTTNMQAHTQDCCIIFKTSPPYLKLSPGRCMAILKGITAEVGLNTWIFTAQMFRKMGVMVGINAAIKPDTIFQLGGW